MAKRRHSVSHSRAQRDLSRIASDPFSEADEADPIRALIEPFEQISTVVRSIAPEIEDHRFFEPEPARTLSRTFGTRPARTVTSWGSPSGVRFASPRQVLVCFRRNVRKEVLHALGRVGRGSGNRRVRKRSRNSGVHC